MEIKNNGRNKVKISYDPYAKKIEYLIWDREKADWYPPAGESPFSQSSFTDNTTIQNKIHEIINAIIDHGYCNGTEGVDIYFEGTDEDFDYIKPIVESQASKMSLYKGDRYLDSVREVLPGIKDHYSTVKELLNNYPDEDIQKEVNKYKDAANPGVSICVMGLYSSGKSAFINALIGREILPSSDDPYTAKIYKIMLGDKYVIHFNSGTEDVALEFYGNKYSVNKTGEVPIIKELQEKLCEDVGAEKRMYKALQIINDVDKKYSVSDMIEVTVPPNRSTLPVDRYDFVIYDTPGPNSAYYKEEHLKVLQNSLSNQSCGLPIYIATKDNTDQVDNNMLIEAIQDCGDSLDKASTIVVINKADDIMSVKDFNNKREKVRTQAISELGSSRICFVSSIVGLGSKKENPDLLESWVDEGFYETYGERKKKFYDLSNSSYKQLYNYNLMPEKRFNDYCDSVENEMDERKLTFINSGLHCVESEIAEFAENYADYNKCAQAGEYLENAINVTAYRINAKSDEQEALSEDISAKWDAKHEKLKNRLKDECSKKIEHYSSKYVSEMSSWLAPHLDFHYVEEKLTPICREINKTKITEREETANALINPLYSEAINSFLNDAVSFSKSFWEDACSNFRESCLKIVLDSDALTKAEKQGLENYIMNTFAKRRVDETISVRDFDSYKSRKWLFVRVERIDPKKCISEFEAKVRTRLTSLNQEILNANKNRFKSWCTNLEIGLETEIADINPELRTLAEELRSCQEELDRLKEQYELLKTHSNAIASLMCFKGV